MVPLTTESCYNTELLQSYIDALFQWWDKNGMVLNINICYHVSVPGKKILIACGLLGMFLARYFPQEGTNPNRAQYYYFIFSTFYNCLRDVKKKKWFWVVNVPLPISLVFCYLYRVLIVTFQVAGWGFDHQDTISNTLQQITIPIVSELTCVRNTSSFFNQNLNINKFCAGFANGKQALLKKNV